MPEQRGRGMAVDAETVRVCEELRRQGWEVSADVPFRARWGEMPGTIEVAAAGSVGVVRIRPAPAPAPDAPETAAPDRASRRS